MSHHSEPCSKLLAITVAKQKQSCYAEVNLWKRVATTILHSAKLSLRNTAPVLPTTKQQATTDAR